MYSTFTIKILLITISYPKELYYYSLDHYTHVNMYLHKFATIRILGIVTLHLFASIIIIVLGDETKIN